MYATELQVPKSGSFGEEIPITKLKRYKSPGFDQIPTERIQAGGNILCCQIDKRIPFGIRRNHHSSTHLQKV